MQRLDQESRPGRLTRGRLLRSAIGGGVIVAGGAALAARGGDATSLAAPSQQTDGEILNLFLLLERAQEGFYRAALAARQLKGDLLSYAETVVKQETEHAAFLTKQLGSRARPAPRSQVAESLTTADGFGNAAVELEEATLAAYVGQTPNLTRGIIADVAVLVSVEARQAAWVRSIVGESPAPRAADPARKPDDVIAELRKRGFIA